MIFKYLKIFFICVKHGINPFSTVGKSIGKAAERFSDNEKEFYINACKNEYSKEYMRKRLYG